MADRVVRFMGIPLSKRETLLARLAADEAIKHIFEQMRAVGDKRIEHCNGLHYAADKYPLPTVERPRVVADENYEWKIERGTLMVRNHGGETDWEPAHQSCAATRERASLWYDLYQNPTETVEVES